MAGRDSLRVLLATKGPLAAIGLINASMVWGLHFIFEFAFLFAAGLDPFNIVFHLGGFIIGSFFFILWFSKNNLNSVLLTTCIGLGLSLIILSLFQNPILIIVILSLTGFSIGSVGPLYYIYGGFITTNQESAGRDMLAIYIPVGFVIIIGTIIVSTGIEVLLASYFAVLLFLFILSFSFVRRSFSLSPRKSTLREYLNKQNFPLPVLLLSLIMGFFVTNSYYTAIVLLNTSEEISLSFPYPESLFIFVFVFFLTSMITCLPCGFLSDRLGRRLSILIGLYLGAFVYFLIPILPMFIPNISEVSILLGIFPIFLGVSITLVCFGGISVANYELAPKEFLMIHGGVGYVFWGLGCVTGVITVELLKPLMETQPILLPFVMIFAYLIATIVVNQNKEPLLSKTEQDWEKLFFRRKDAIKKYAEAAQKIVEKIEPLENERKS